MIGPLLLWLASSALAAEFASIPSRSFDRQVGATGVPARVTIPAFSISATEVTQAEFERVTGRNPAHYRGSKRPVENVSWWDAIRYCNRRSELERLRSCYDLSSGERDRSCDGYRLPTEDEWESARGAAAAQGANLGVAETRSVEPLMALVREKGTRDVASEAANANGVFDATGNVWEWCEDSFNAAPGLAPPFGIERTIRGGSFVSAPSRSRDYRASMLPDTRSRFTGFRVARSLPAAAIGAPAADWFRVYDTRPKGFETATGGLSRLAPEGLAAAGWPARRNELRAKWMKLLGEPSVKPPAPAVRLIAEFEEEDYRGRMLLLQVEPDFWEKIYVMIPRTASKKPLPVLLTPYYDVDTPAGRNLGGRLYTPPGVRSFAYLAVKRGYIAIAIRWFGESYGERYQEAVANLNLRHPKWTGMGKWAWDAQRLVDYVGTMPEADPSRIGIVGQSLGGKMALYAAAFDDRIKAAVSSEGGIGLGFSNYEDYWYFGRFIKSADADQHELLGLIAPRSFLLIGGNSADSDKSWHYINEARSVYTLLGSPRNIGYFNHRTGHTPSPESVRLGMEWLDRFLDNR